MKSKTSKFFAWMIVFLLVVGLAGFGIQDVLRRSGGNDIIKIGNQKVSSEEYARAIQQEIVSLSMRLGTNLTFEQANSLGVSQTTFQKLLTLSILNDAAEKISLSRGDAAVIKNISENEAFMDISGKFDQNLYEMSLSRINLTKKEYEHEVRKELSREFILAMTDFKVDSSSDITEKIQNYLSETRVAKVFSIPKNELINLAEKPTDSQLKAFYDENASKFTHPETKEYSFILIEPEMIAENQSVLESEILDRYNSQADTYNVPELRTIDRLVFNTLEKAKSALNRINNKTVTFDQLVEERNLTPEDISLGSIKKQQLELLIQDTIFSEPNLGIFGPFQTDLGPAIFRVTSIIPEKIKSLEEVEAKILKEITLEKSNLKITKLGNTISDEIAAGVSLEEIAQAEEIEIGKLILSEGDALPDFVKGSDFGRALKTASEYASNIGFTDTGGIFSVRLDRTNSEFLKPFDSVTDSLVMLTKIQLFLLDLESKRNSIKVRLQEGKEIDELLGISHNAQPVDYKISRFEKNEVFSDKSVKDLFEIKIDDVLFSDYNNKINIIQLVKIISSNDTFTEENLLMGQIKRQYDEGIKKDIISALINGLRRRQKIEINQTSIDQTLSRFQ